MYKDYQIVKNYMKNESKNFKEKMLGNDYNYFLYMFDDEVITLNIAMKLSIILSDKIYNFLKDEKNEKLKISLYRYQTMFIPIWDLLFELRDSLNKLEESYDIKSNTTMLLIHYYNKCYRVDINIYNKYYKYMENVIQYNYVLFNAIR
jgi:hypothetical protein